MGKQLFGTDGIRGVAGEYPLDPPTVHALGVALADTARHLAPDPEILLGMDTRESGPWIAGQVAGGLSERGVKVRFAGVITTPGVAYLTRTGPFAAGVMISASHNPYRDNGIKVFGHSGYKLPDQEEHRIEGEMFALLEKGVRPQSSLLPVDPGLDRLYMDFLASTVPAALNGMKVVVDCGNGAASALAPELFERLGAKVHAFSHCPDGRNINLGCGALNPESLSRAVLSEGADLGVAFDGDADRAIFVSESGRIVDGDAVLLLSAVHLKRHGKLRGPEGKPTVVATVMSNLGLERALAAEGIAMVRTPVGDKYVLEEMLRSGAPLGGEQSGHVIFLDYSTTGDGMLTALRVMEVMRETGKRLDELTSALQVYPQRLVNVRVRKRRPLSELTKVNDEIRAAEAAFGDAGRVLVRFSGTEPLARIMVEGPELAQVETFANRIAGAIERELGG
jgi:phosphoglucosamine mutase